MLRLFPVHLVIAQGGPQLAQGGVISPASLRLNFSSMKGKEGSIGDCETCGEGFTARGAGAAVTITPILTRDLREEDVFVKTGTFFGVCKSLKNSLSSPAH